MKYYPILLSKSSELVALANLDESVKSEVSPVIELLPGRIEAVENMLTDSWSFDDNQVLLDFSLYGEFDKSQIKIVRKFLKDLIEGGVNAIPVIQQNSDKDYLSIVLDIIDAYDWKVCIRASNDSGGFVNYNDIISELMDDVGVSEPDTILLLDFGFVELKNYNVLALVASTTIAAIPGLKTWNDIIIATSSFPEHLGDVKPANKVHRLPRYEWDIWNTLLKNKAIAPYITYGDYGTKYPTHSEMPYAGTCSIKYTVEDEYVIYKGELSKYHKDGNGQYITFANRLIVTDDYSGPDFSWGDEKIDKIAKEAKITTRKLKPGGAKEWVQISQNHHITFLHSIL